MEDEEEYSKYHQAVLDIIGASPATPVVAAPGSDLTIASSSPATPEQTKEFYQRLFKYLGIPETEGNLLFVRAWAQIEGSEKEGDRPTYNPLSTTYPPGASSKFNSTGVRNYPDMSTGIRATANTIKAPSFDKILDALKNGIPDKSKAIELSKKWEKKYGPLWTWVNGSNINKGDLPPYISGVLAGTVRPGTIHIPK